MFAVIYRFKLKPDQEERYQQYWRIVAQYFIEQRGALGSCLHKGNDGLWVAILQSNLLLRFCSNM